MRRRRSQPGLALVELIVAFTIMTLLTAMAVPLARFRVRREKERELRYSLRELHTAIDKYKDACDKNVFQSKLGTECYPENLDQLVEGVKIASDASGKKIKFLRRIPRDPFMNSTDWGMRSTQDDPKSTGGGGQNVFAVFSKTMEKSADGTPYAEW